MDHNQAIFEWTQFIQFLKHFVDNRLYMKFKKKKQHKNYN